MVKKKIKDMTIKDIFDSQLGKKNAKKVLTKIQKVYDDGVRGKTFQEFVKSTIEEIPNHTLASIKVVSVASSITNPPPPRQQAAHDS
jgi:hypothetical protein